MKKTIMQKKSLTLAALFFGLSLSVVSCDKDDDQEVQSTTIADIVSTNNNYTLLRSAVVKANLANTLSGNGPFTVFAPNDEAFTASGITSSTISSLSASDLSNILLYHTLGSKVASGDVPAGPNAAVTTANDQTVYVTKNNRGVFVNGFQVTQADINASNGVIHSIERVLIPPAGNLVQLAQSNSNLTYLVAAVLRASEGSTNVAQILSSNDAFTVFAPTNQAFIDAGFATISAIQAADPNTLANILTYHVLSGRAFSSDLSNGQVLTTAQGGTLAVTLGNTATIKGASNSTAANITNVNIMATNGVVHLIDKVLLP